MYVSRATLEDYFKNDHPVYNAQIMNYLDIEFKDPKQYNTLEFSHHDTDVFISGEPIDIIEFARRYNAILANFKYGKYKC